MDTLHYVKCGLETLSRSTEGKTDEDFGRHLLLRTLAEALEAGKEQIRAEIVRARAHATVKALKNGSREHRYHPGTARGG